jgi:hypothetical protein
MLPPDIFDNFIQGESGASFQDLGFRINALPQQNQNITNFLRVSFCLREMILIYFFV